MQRLLLALLVSMPAVAMSQSVAPGPLDVLSGYDGVWRGPATVIERDGKKRTLIQTERVGPTLQGAIRVIEGHSYNPDGSEGGFNAFAVVSRGNDGLEFRAYAQGHAGTFPMQATGESFEWSMPAGPGATIHYSARIASGVWHEEGWYERGGQHVSQVFTMNLRRVASTDWPVGQSVRPR